MVKVRHALAGLLIMYTIAIIVLAMLPLTGIADSSMYNDKVLHFTEFFVFTILLKITLNFYEHEDIYLTALVIVLFVALVTELVQIPVYGRQFSHLDMIADLGGALAAGIVYFVIETVHKKWTSSRQ